MRARQSVSACRLVCNCRLNRLRLRCCSIYLKKSNIVNFVSVVVQTINRLVKANVVDIFESAIF